MPESQFPEGFRWGVATAAHQVEGGNTNNDWWAWEHDPESPCAESSGDACDQWNRYRSDIEMLAALGFDNYRFSVEWSRIEPADGEFSKSALDHYRSVCATCLEHGIEPVVTYHHFTTPLWLTQRGGWLSDDAPEVFARFCERVTQALGDLTGRVCTINEPNVVAFVGYMLGLFPPGHSDMDECLRVQQAFIEAHRRAVDAVKSVADLPVGLTLAMSDYQAVPADDPQAINSCNEARRLMEDPFLEAVKGDDFMGVQTYSRMRFGPAGLIGPEEGVEVVEYMGYEFWPDSLEATIRRAWDVSDGVPLIVTENGLSHTDDRRRIEYVEQALQGVLRCIADGIDVGGYTYWSLLDNFEWAFGYGPRFGLVAVDRSTQQRTPKASARWLGDIARTNAIRA
ncbi:MAG: Beta-glucosidase A [Acidimicrobiales bacterium]|nr:MAG: glycosyl hydrolase family protein [Actinomycetota bacterium]MBV6508638.1 Beta-glucosidase A [Acidimicrobiales bacterium]RIK08083.1 MAG: beta-glucosidase [Acidobacteriota bacterium]